MRKTKELIVSLTIIVVSLTLLICATILYAAPGDVEITIVIPADKVADFSAGFLAKLPIPLMDDPASTVENPLPQIPKYTSKQWQ